MIDTASYLCGIQKVNHNEEQAETQLSTVTVAVTLCILHTCIYRWLLAMIIL